MGNGDKSGLGEGWKCCWLWISGPVRAAAHCPGGGGDGAAGSTVVCVALGRVVDPSHGVRAVAGGVTGRWEWGALGRQK